MPQEVELDLARAERRWFAGDKVGGKRLAGLWLGDESLSALIKQWEAGTKVWT